MMFNLGFFKSSRSRDYTTAIRRPQRKKKVTHYTMMIVPNGQNQAIKKYCIPMWAVKGFIALSLTCILIVGYFISGFFYLRYVAVENERLKEINSAQEKELKELQGLAGSMRDKLEALVALDQEVRAKVGLTVTSSSNSAEEKSLNIESNRAESRYQFITRGLLTPVQEADKELNVTAAMVPLETDGQADELIYLGESPNLEALSATSQGLSLTEEGKTNPLAELKEELARMDALMIQQIENMTKLSADVDKQKAMLAATPDYWPYNGRITSRFGWRKNPFTGKGREFHEGVDIAGSYGAAVRAAGDGIVTYAGYKGTYGRLVVISHGYGYVTYYAHNFSIVVKTGDRVTKGQIISRIGSTGRSTGPHLHFGVTYQGKWIDPLSVGK